MEPQNSQYQTGTDVVNTHSTSKKGFLILIIALFIVLVGTGLSIYISTKTKSEVSIPITETLDWKTYTNDQYGFEFNYPNTFTTEDTPASDARPFRVVLLSNDGKSSFYVAINSPGHGICSPGEDNPTTNTVTIDTETAQQVSCNNVEKSEWFLFHHNSLEYEILFSSVPDDKFHQIISSFKFADKTINPKTESSQIPMIQKNKYDDFATCLKDKGAKFYGAFWCPHCQAQKAMFGKSASLLPYVECSTSDGQSQTQTCIDKKITSYPTWEFVDGSRFTGEIELSVLGEKTSCELPQ